MSNRPISLILPPAAAAWRFVRFSLALLLCGVCIASKASADDGDVTSPDGSSVDVLSPLSAQPAAGSSGTSSSAGNVPISQVPQLSSLPSSPYKIYLDFTGATIANWSGYHPGTVSAYDQDGDPTTFSPSEIQSIDEAWTRVAEDYSPFNVDVTTIDPGSYGTNQAVRVVISGSGSWYGSPAGGISQVGSFNNASTNASTNGTVFVFPGYLANGTAKYVGIASAHEAGHAFGLVHQSSYSGSTKTAEYGPGTWPGDPNHPFSTPGTGYKSPIMGLGYYADRALWWYGQSSNGYKTYQDDLAILSSNVYGYRPINANGTKATALSLADSGGNVSGAGIIRKTTDQYYYTFTTPGGAANINMDVARFVNTLTGSTSVIGMLDSKLQLFDSGGNLVASAGTAATPSNPSLDASLSLSLSGGVYYVAAESIGNYGDIGQFTLNGSIVPPGPPVIGLTPLNATIITGGTSTVGVTVGNTAAPFNNSLNYTLSAALVSGTATLTAVTPSAGTVAAGSSQLATLAATSTVIGSHTIGFTASDPNATGGTQQSTNATLTVLDHAQPALTASLSQPVVIVGAQGVAASLTLSNGSAGQGNLAPLDVTATGQGVSGPVGSRVVTSGSQQSYTSTLAATALGPQGQTLKVTAGDDHTLSGALAPSDYTATVNYTVMDHANASLSATAAQSSLTLNFGNLLQGSMPQSRSFAIFNLAANTSAALTANLKLTGFSASGDDALGTNLAAFSNLAPGGSNTFTAMIDTSRLTTSGLKTITMDASQLLDDSSLPGAGSNNFGTLTVVLSGTVGAAVADDSNSRSSFGPALSAAVPQGGNYTGLQSQAAGTSATILAGAASAAANVQMAWRTASSGSQGQGADGVLGNVVRLSGMPVVDAQTHNGAPHTDVYVMQMSYDPAAVTAHTGLSESAAAQAGMIALDYLDPGPDGQAYTGDDQWELAVLGNIGSANNRFEGVGPWNGDMQLGDYGVDTTSHTVWAVLDHSSDFAVVPEPGTLWLLVAVAAGIGIWRRKRRKA